MKFSGVERRELLKAWLLVSVAFAIVLGGFRTGFFYIFIISLFTVGIGFLLHELAHKLIAQRYGCFAEFRADNRMLMIMIVMSFFGFVFAAPGGVFILGNINREKNGKISIAGPVTNIILAVVFLFLGFLIGGDFFNYGFRINSLLAFFNMLPFWSFDGAKVLSWSKFYYFLAIIIAFGLLLVSNIS